MDDSKGRRALTVGYPNEDRVELDDLVSSGEAVTP